MKQQTGRKIILHDVPPWVDPDASLYFITVCCKHRGTNQLCLPGIGDELLDSVRFYRTRQKWFPWLFLLMPDHVHMIVTFGEQTASKRCWLVGSVTRLPSTESSGSKDFSSIGCAATRA